MNYKEFEEKVKSMTAHDIIMAMVDGLRQPRTKIDMGTFGNMIHGVCYGCAATNAVLSIMEAEEKEVEDLILERESWVSYMRAGFREGFEYAINHLRAGNVDLYNEYSMKHRIAQIAPKPDLYLPYLGNNYTEEELQQYEKLAKYQLTIKN